MNERIVKNKTLVMPSQAIQSSSSLLHQLSLIEELSESLGSNSNISKELGGIQPKTVRRSLNWQNITVEAPSRGNGMSLPGEIQRQQEKPGAVIADRVSADSSYTLGQSKMATGADTGRDPTPDTIREGSVRMEEHPQYQETIRQVTEAGFEITFSNEARIEVKEVVGSDGNTVRVEKTLYVKRNMRYLDLEHELGHIKQLERFGDNIPPTTRVTEKPDGSLKAASNQQGTLTVWQNTITEYHNRLEEFIRLYERGATPELLKEHADGVEQWSQEYRKKGLKLGHSKSQEQWAKQYFPDIAALGSRYREIVMSMKQ